MRLSVIIPTRDRLPLLQRAIDSVCRQRAPVAVEIIVVDNAAETPLRASDLACDCRCEIIIARTEQKLSAAGSRNFGAARASGAWISFLDDDDEIEGDKFEAHLGALLGDPQIDFVYGQTRHVGPEGETMMTSSGPPVLTEFLRWRHIHVNALTMRREAFEAVRFSEEMATFEDVDFVARLLARHKGLHLPAVHAIWRRDRRPDQMTNPNWRRSYENWLRLCRNFHDVIVSDRDLRRFYHRKMLALSGMFGDWRQAARSLPLAI